MYEEYEGIDASVAVLPWPPKPGVPVGCLKSDAQVYPADVFVPGDNDEYGDSINKQGRPLGIPGYPYHPFDKANLPGSPNRSFPPIDTPALIKQDDKPSLIERFKNLFPDDLFQRKGGGQTPC